ncbi:MAG: FkbM family methyltransferase [Chloroflexi bacterium]|nr:FkbM family methyltransferase [Chloroflexota bacterium]
MAKLDFPIWVKLYGINHKAQIRSVRNASYLLSTRIIEPEIGALFIAISKVLSPKVFWDVGANIGYYSWLLNSNTKDLEVFLFEPDPINYQLLIHTIERYKLYNLKPFATAISDGIGKADFAVDSDSGATGTLEKAGKSFSSRHYKVLPKTIVVEKTSIDEVRWNIEKNQLISLK